MLKGYRIYELRDKYNKWKYIGCTSRPLNMRLAQHVSLKGGLCDRYPGIDKDSLSICELASIITDDPDKAYELEERITWKYYNKGFVLLNKEYGRNKNVPKPDEFNPVIYSLKHTPRDDTRPPKKRYHICRIKSNEVALNYYEMLDVIENALHKYSCIMTDKTLSKVRKKHKRIMQKSVETGSNLKVYLYPFDNR